LQNKYLVKVMNYRYLRVGAPTLLAFAVPLVYVACALDEPHPPIIIGGGGKGGAATVGTGGGSSTTTNPTTTSGMGGSGPTTSGGGKGGSGGGATTGPGGSAGSAGAGGAGGAAGSGGAGGAGGDMGGAGAGGDMGGAGAGGDMDAGIDAGQTPVKNPTGIAVTGSTPTTEVHPSAGGMQFTDLCQPNEVLMGFDGTMDANMDSQFPWLKSLTPRCGTLTLMGTGPFSIGVTKAEQLQERGGHSDLVFPTATCPSNQVIVGFSGRAGGYIDNVGFSCAPLLVTGDATNGYTITIDTANATTIGPLGGTGGNDFGLVPCPDGQVSNGVNVYSGSWFDGFSLTCGVISLTGTRF
jgi:hypothetical protein